MARFTERFMSRRSILGSAIAASSAVSLGLVCRGHFDSMANDGSYRLSHLLDADNKPTALVDQLLGRVIKVRGVPSPSTAQGAAFNLMDLSAGLCPGCGFFHDFNRSLAVLGAPGKDAPRYFEPELIIGSLHLNEDAKLQLIL